MNKENLPTNWKIVKLGEVCNVKTSFPLFNSINFINSKKEETDELVLALKVSDMNIPRNQTYVTQSNNSFYCSKEKLNKFLKPGSIIFPKRGAAIGTNKKRKVLNYSILDPNLIGIEPSSCVDSDYLLFFFKRFDLRSLQDNNPIPQLNKNDVEEVMLFLPPLPEQQAIARALRAVQQTKEARQRELELERERKEALMNYLFTHGTRGEKLKQTEIGEMPESWEVVKIKQFASVQGGYAFKSADYTINGIPLFKISNVSFSRVSWDDISFLPKEYIFKYREYSLKPGDIVMAMTRPVVLGGIKVAKLSDEDVPSLLNQRVCRFIIMSNVEPNYLFHYIHHHFFISSVIQSATGSQQPNISSSQIENILIPVPKLFEQKEMADILSSCNTTIYSLEKEISILDELFRAMLEELMTGRLSAMALVTGNE